MFSRRRCISYLMVLAAAVLASCFAQQSGSVLLDDRFADGNSQSQDLANNSVWLFNGRTNNIRTDAPGSVTFDVTPAGSSSEAVWAFFTPSGAPVTLAIGDKLTVSVTFSLAGFGNNGQDIRWGVLDSQGTRNTTNLAGGMNDSSFIGDTGYGLQYYASGAGSPFVLGRRTLLTGANVFNNFADFAVVNGTGAQSRQALVDATPYTLTYSIERLTATTTRLTASVTGGTLTDYNYSGVENSATPATTFDYFGFRIAGSNFTRTITFTRILVQYLPAPPVITSQPQPSSLTVQVGTNVTMAVGASGSAISYQWQKDGKDLPAANDSVRTATLSLPKVQLSDAGSYTAMVSNSGGSVVSNPVVLKVSTTPVPPPPSILSQPADTTATAGYPSALTVKASGDGLFYQWFKNGVLIPGAQSATLLFPNAQLADAATYTVVVSNSSGTVTSAPARLLVVSPMVAISVFPWPGYTGLCPDSMLTMDFNTPVQPGKSGRIRVFDATGQVVDSIDMSANPQTKVIGGTPFSYYPVMVNGNRATITLHKQLPYGGTYSVVVEPGVVTDANGAPYGGLLDASLWKFSTRAAAPAAGTSSLVVSTEDQGDFCTVQGAIDFVPAGNPQQVWVTLRPGTYTEIVYVPSNKPFITVLGDERDNSVVSYPNNNNLNPSTLGRPVFGVDAPDFTLANLTVVNSTIKGGSQAEAFRGNNKHILLTGVNLKSYQDTLLLQGGGLVTDSYIEGDVDFMWGTGPVFIQNSELKGLSSGGYYTQIRNGQGQNGYVFLNDKLTRAEGVTGMYLSRIDPTVFPYSQVAFLNCAMGPHIAPVGWMLTNATTAPNVQFWEYQSTDLDGAPLAVSGRAPFSRQLTAKEAAQWSDPLYVLGWVPYSANPVEPLVRPGETVRVNWTAPAGHSEHDWIGLFETGQAVPVARQELGRGHRGQVSFSTPAHEARYEIRLYRSLDGNRATARSQVSARH